MLLSRWRLLLLPLVVAVAVFKFLLGFVAVQLSRWFSVNLIDRWSVKKSRCSLEGLFRTNSIHGKNTCENLQFFSNVVMENYCKLHNISHHHCEQPIIVKSFQLDKSAINYVADINFFVEIEYEKDHPWVKEVGLSNLPSSVFIKSLPRRISGRAGQVLLGIHECEAIHFTELFSCEGWFPKDIMPNVLYSNYNYYTTDYLLILEDLRGKFSFKGYSPSLITREEKLKTLEIVAKLHASGMAYLRSLPEKERELKIDEMDSRTKVLYGNTITTLDIVLFLSHNFASEKITISTEKLLNFLNVISKCLSSHSNSEDVLVQRKC